MLNSLSKKKKKVKKSLKRSIDKGERPGFEPTAWPQDILGLGHTWLKSKWLGPKATYGVGLKPNYQTKRN